MSTNSPLVVRMRVYAAAHPPNEHMLKLANELELAVDAYAVAPTPADAEVLMKRMIGAVARARLHWRDVTGEPLVPESTIQTGAKLFSALMPRRAR